MSDIFLKSGGDHSYREVEIINKKVVWNQVLKTYSEYFGDEYLEPNEVVVCRNVIE